MKLGLCLCILLLIIPHVSADDTMFRANAQHTGEYKNSGARPGNSELWRQATGSTLGTSPALSNGIIFVGGSTSLYAFDAVSGAKKWEFTRGNEIYSPAVSNGAVYVGSNDQYFYALDAVTGGIKWQFRTNNKVTTSPTVSQGVVYFGSGNITYAVSADTGQEKWKSESAEVKYAPAVADGTIFSLNYGSGFGNGRVTALDAASGKEKWKYSWDYSFYNSPMVADGIVYLTETGDGSLVALDSATGTVKWNVKTKYSPSSPAISKGLVFVGSTDFDRLNDIFTPLSRNQEEKTYHAYLFAYDAATGNMKWRFTCEGKSASDPVIANGVVYFGSGDGTFYAVDASNGREIWHYDLGGIVVTSPLVANGIVYVGGDDGIFHALGGSATSQTAVSTTTNAPVTPVTTAIITSQITESPGITPTVMPTVTPPQGGIGDFAPALVIIIVVGLVIGAVIIWKKTDNQQKREWETFIPKIFVFFVLLIMSVNVWAILTNFPSLLILIVGSITCLVAMISVLVASQRKDKDKV